MNKQTDCAFDKDVYLLGTDKEGVRYWLEQGTWDCDWYWGIGYVETYKSNRQPHTARDIDSHQHFNRLFFNKGINGHDAFKAFFAETPLSDREIWTLCELMKSLYIFREYSDTIHTGGAHYTTNPCKETIQNASEYERINKTVIPALLAEVYKLLSPAKNA